MASQALIHPKANIEGSVQLGANTSVWPFASLRGDEGKIVVGKSCSIQDGVVMHGSDGKGVAIGDNVIIGHQAIIHAATVGNNVLIGMGSRILTGAVIGDWCIIAAGAVVTENMKIPSGSVVMGFPAKIVRKIAEKDKKLITDGVKNYVKNLNPALQKRYRKV